MQGLYFFLGTIEILLWCAATKLKTPCFNVTYASWSEQRRTSFFEEIGFHSVFEKGYLLWIVFTATCLIHAIWPLPELQTNSFFAYCGIKIEAEEMHPSLFSPCVIGQLTASKCWLLASKHKGNREKFHQHNLRCFLSRLCPYPASWAPMECILEQMVWYGQTSGTGWVQRRPKNLLKILVSKFTLAVSIILLIVLQIPINFHAFHFVWFKIKFTVDCTDVLPIFIKNLQVFFVL